MKTTLIILLTAHNLYCQTGLNKIDDFIKNERIDTFLVYEQLCIGFIQTDTCEKSHTQVVFYRKNGIDYKLKFQKCDTYSIDTLISENPLNFYLVNKSSILKYNIKPPSYYDRVKTKKGWKKRELSVYVSHSCFYKFYLLDKQKIIEKTIDGFMLNSKTFEDGKTNIYFTYNQKLKQKELIDITKKILEE